MHNIDFQKLDMVVSKNPLLTNYGKGRILKIKNGMAKVEYIPHVFSSPPYFAHTKLLKLEETKRIPSPIELLEDHQIEETWKFDLRQMAARFLTANKGGQLSNTRTELLPHQIFTAYEVVKSQRRRFLLADEVGLGKTIEAGIIWQALFQRGVASRTLIISPAGLTLQWQEEMQEKFGAFFEIFNRDFYTINPRIWDLKTTAIASIDTLKRTEHKNKLLENRKWDLIIFDEAHKLSAREYGTKLDKTENFKLAEDLKNYTNALILITATPHQGEDNHSRFINMVELLDKNIDFSALAYKDLPLFHTVAESNSTPYFEYILRTPKSAVTDASGHKVFKGRQTHKYAFNMFPDEKIFYQAVTDYITRGYSYLERIADKQKRLALGFVLSTFQKIAASSTIAIKDSLRRRKMFLENKRVIIQEESLFEDDRFIGEYEESQVAFKYDEQFIKSEIKKIDSLLDMNVVNDVKSVEIIKFIKSILRKIKNEKDKKIVIFTEYLATQNNLINILEKEFGNGCVTYINGSLNVDKRRLNRYKFRDDNNIHFLVSTESGGEGINLQFSHILFNYDLPWNPMRIEQRIGRIYRYGQDKVVQIYNFRTKETIEDKIYKYIEAKIERSAKALSKVTGEDVEDIVSTMYGEMENEIDYNEIYKRSLVEGDIKESKDEIDRGIARAKRAYELAKEKLFKEASSYNFDNYEKHLKTELSLQDLESFVKRYLKIRRKQVFESDGVYSFITPNELEDDSIEKKYKKVTFSRKKAIDHPELEFFAIGHPFIDKVMSLCGSIEFGGYVTSRLLHNENYKGVKGIQFNYIVRNRIQRQEEEEFLFDMYTIFIDKDYRINDEIAYLCQRNYSLNENDSLEHKIDIDVQKAENIAKEYLQQKIKKIWDWEEDVELLNIALVYIE